MKPPPASLGDCSTASEISLPGSFPDIQPKCSLSSFHPISPRYAKGFLSFLSINTLEMSVACYCQIPCPFTHYSAKLYVRNNHTGIQESKESMYEF